MWFKRHITGIFDFRTRENRQPFWLWALLVYGAQMVLSWILAGVMIAGMISQVVTLAQANPGVDPFKDNPGAVFDMMRPFMQSMMVLGSITAIVTLLLMAAAVVRRLHDRDMSGWWTLPVFAWHIASPIVAALAMPKMLDQMAKIKVGPGMQGNPGMAMMTGDLAWIQVAQSVGFLVMLILVVFLALPGTPGANRFGPDPLDDGKLPNTFS